MALDGPTMRDRIDGYFSDLPRCNGGDAGRTCTNPATQRIALIYGDGTESRYGTFCGYHAGTRHRFWTDAVAVEYRNMDDTVIRRVGLIR